MTSGFAICELISPKSDGLRSIDVEAVIRAPPLFDDFVAESDADFPS